MSEEKKDQENRNGQDDSSLEDAPMDSAGGDETGDLPPGFTIEEVEPKKGGGCMRILLLMLLLVVAAGAGLFYFAGEMFSPEPVVVTHKEPQPGKMKVPVRKQSSAKQEPVAEEVMAKEEVAAVPKKKNPVTDKASAVKPQEKTVAKEDATPVFALSSGSYLYQGSLKKAVSQIEKLGYKVTRSKNPESHEMTRLLVGRYGRPMAEKRLKEVSEFADGAFLAAEEGKLAVYAGSYISLDKARRAADILYQHGIRVDEKQVKIDIPKTTLTFGGFATREEAERVAMELKKHGVKDPEIISLK